MGGGTPQHPETLKLTSNTLKEIVHIEYTNKATP